MATKIINPNTVKLFNLTYRRADAGVNGAFEMVDPQQATGFAGRWNGPQQGTTITWERKEYFLQSRHVAELLADAKARYGDAYVFRVGTFTFESAELRELIEASATWRERELKRFLDGTYQPVPWADEEDWLNSRWTVMHFAHLSTKDPTKIAYTPDEDAGRRDRQVTMSASRYLARFYGDGCNQAVLERWMAELRRHLGITPELGITTDPDMIEEVYLNGPNSCMSHRVNWYLSSEHPVRAYGHSPDLALAYIKNIGGPSRPDVEEDDDGDCNSGEYSARAIVWPAKKWYGRIYGHAAELKSLLEAQGYTYKAIHHGARLVAIEDDNEDGYLCPYLDNANAVRFDESHDESDYLVIDDCGDMDCHETGGIARRSRTSWVCECCEEGFTDDDAAHDVDDGSLQWCENCLDRHAYYCHSDNQYYSCNDDLVQIDRGPERGDWYHSDDAFYCEFSEEYWHVRYMATANRDGDEVSVAERYLDDAIAAWSEPEDTEGAEDAAEAA